MNIICFCIESEHTGQPSPSLSSLNLVMADSELTSRSIVKGVVRMKVTGRWSDVISGWWSSVLLLGYYKGGCTFRLEEYAVSEECGSLLAQRDSLRFYNITSRGHAFGPARLLRSMRLPTCHCTFLILRGWLYD